MKERKPVPVMPDTLKEYLGIGDVKPAAPVEEVANDNLPVPDQQNDLDSFSMLRETNCA